MPIDRETFEAGEERYSVENEIIQFLHRNHEQAYDLREIAVEVLDTGRPDPNGEDPDFEELVDRVLDLATVSSILDSLVDDGRLKRRIVDTEEGERSYFRAP